MSCFPCFRSQKSIKSLKANGNPGEDAKAADTRHKGSNGEDVNQGENGNIAAQTFTFRELATATKNFRQECLLGEGGFGRVYKGTLAPTGKVVAVKQLDRHGSEGNKDFLDEVSIISLLKHENLVKLVGYCADGDQRVLVYEFMPGGTLENHLLDIPPEKKPLDWFTRMKILFGAAQALEYLHDQANPPVVYRDLKTSNILLGGELNPKLSGLAKPSRAGDNMQIASRVMGTYGYCAPEYQASGDLTSKSDVYSFGVIFLEVITGRRAIDTTKPNDEQNLVAWAQPLFRDAKQFPDLADPLLEKRFPEKDLNQAVATAAMCLQEEPGARPLMRDIVAVLSFLSMEKEIIMPTPKPPATPTLEERVTDHDQQENKAEDSSDSESSQDEASDREDAQIGNHQIHYVREHDGDTSHHHNDDHSDSEDGDSVDMEDGEAEDDYYYSNSYSKRQVNSIMNSMSDRNSSNLETSSRSHGRRVSLGHLDSGGSQDGSISSSENSSRGSQGCDAFLSQKSNKVSRHARSRKSTRKSEGRSGSTGQRSSRKSRTKSTRHDDSSDQGSQEGSISSNHSSTRGSEHGNNHLDHTNSGGSEDGIVHLL